MTSHRKTLLLWTLLSLFTVFLLLTGYMVYLAETLEAGNDTYTVRSKYPYAILSPGDQVVVVDYAPFYGAPFPYSILPLDEHVRITVNGLKECKNVRAAVAWLWGVYLAGSKAAYYRPPYILVDGSAKEAFSALRMAEISGREIASNMSAVIVLPSSSVPEGYEPQYSIIILCHSNTSAEVCTGISCGPVSSILVKADRLLHSYMNKPAGRRAEAEALSLIHSELSPLYKLYGYPGVEIRVATWFRARPLFYLYPAATALLLFSLLYLLIRLTASYAREASCPYARVPLVYFSRQLFAWLSVAGIIALVLAFTFSILSPLGLLVSLPGIFSLESIVRKAIPCNTFYRYGWLAVGSALLSLVAEGATFMAMLLFPGPFFPTIYWASLLLFYASLAAMTPVYVQSYRAGVRGGLVAAAAVTAPLLGFMLGTMLAHGLLFAASTASWYLLGHRELL